MFDRFLQAWRSPAPALPAPQSRAEKYESEGVQGMLERQREATRQQAEAFLSSVRQATRQVKVTPAALRTAATTAGAMDAMDSSDSGLPAFKQASASFGQSEMQLMPWFMRQGFIGYQNAAFLAQNWLVFKACATPVDDAIRNGYEVVRADGKDIPEEALQLVKSADRKFAMMGQLRDFGTKGRIFGLRLAMFIVESSDPRYYEKPYNPDGVTEGSYKGISQIDPYWVAPILDSKAAGDPTYQHFYEPTWWQIGSRRVHRSHLVLFRYAEPPDVLKPLYLFGGIPLPQMIMERVYAAERTANEAPALALSKRTTVWLTNLKAVMANTAKAMQTLQDWIAYRDNFGIKLGDKDKDEMQQFDTPLADFDKLVMTQYGLVASTAGMPICKLLGTTPGGFAATGDYDEGNYHELLESMEERDFTPLLERHHELVMRSEVIPKFPKLKGAEIVVKWNELDALTHLEQAQVNTQKAQTGAALVASGAIDPRDERARVAGDKESGYHGIGVDFQTEPLPDEQEDDPGAAAEAARGGKYAAKGAVEKETDERAGSARDAWQESQHPRDREGRFSESEEGKRALVYGDAAVEHARNAPGKEGLTPSLRGGGSTAYAVSHDTPEEHQLALRFHRLAAEKHRRLGRRHRDANGPNPSHAASQEAHERAAAIHEARLRALGHEPE